MLINLALLFLMIILCFYLIHARRIGHILYFGHLEQLERKRRNRPPHDPDH